MIWNQEYRHLEEGEIIRATDEIQDDFGLWKKVQHAVGKPAPDPNYTSHRQYRRKKGLFTK